MGYPWHVAFALQKDGWYLRSDIIWAKPNATPESVRDRPTKAHEYLFLLTKSAKYYYDAEAIKEPVKEWTGQAATWERSGPVSGHIIPGQSAAQHRKNRSGNKERKMGSVRGRPDSHLGGSIPWEGNTRNKRTVWNIATRPFKEAHFAVFPPELIRPCILAGTSPQTCQKCGASWKRITEKGEPIQQHWAPGTQEKIDKGQGITVGWESTCSCQNNDGSGKAIILDPFGGSGTVALVAEELGRDSIYIDLKPEYAEMAKRRAYS